MSNRIKIDPNILKYKKSAEQIIQAVLVEFPGEEIDIHDWLEGRYQPTPTIIEAAKALYGSQHNDIYLDDASLVAVGAGTTSITSAQPSAAAGGPVFMYTVRHGDNYYRIARRFGLTVGQLYQANKISGSNRNLLLIGTVLIIPGATANT